MTIPQSNLAMLFSDDDAERLEAMLERFLDHGGLPLEAVDGLLSAIVVAVDVIPPSEYLPSIVGEEAPIWETTEQAQEFFGLLMRLNNHIADRVAREPDDSSRPFLMTPDAVENLDDAALANDDFPIATDWAIGFMIGVGMRDDDWDERSAATDGLAEALRVIALLLPDPTDVDNASPEPASEARTPLRWSAADEVAEELSASAADRPMTLTERMSIVALLPDILHRLHLDRLERTHAHVPVRRDPKVGRNEPCPCGSGKKYKKCHGDGVH